MIWTTRNRAKQQNIEHTITEEDLDLPTKCPISMIEIDYHRTSGNLKAYPSLDRVDNSKGYIKGNVRVVSHRGNAWKNDMSLEDIKRLYEYALSASSR